MEKTQARSRAELVSISERICALAIFSSDTEVPIQKLKRQIMAMAASMKNNDIE
jgi:hypothetical protein